MLPMLLQEATASSSVSQVEALHLQTPLPLQVCPAELEICLLLLNVSLTPWESLGAPQSSVASSWDPLLQGV